MYLEVATSCCSIVSQFVCKAVAAYLSPNTIATTSVRETTWWKYKSGNVSNLIKGLTHTFYRLEIIYKMTKRVTTMLRFNC